MSRIMNFVLVCLALFASPRTAEALVCGSNTTRFIDGMAYDMRRQVSSRQGFDESQRAFNKVSVPFSIRFMPMGLFGSPVGRVRGEVNIIVEISNNGSDWHELARKRQTFNEWTPRGTFFVFRDYDGKAELDFAMTYSPHWRATIVSSLIYDRRNTYVDIARIAGPTFSGCLQATPTVAFTPLPNLQIPPDCGNPGLAALSGGGLSPALDSNGTNGYSLPSFSGTTVLTYNFSAEERRHYGARLDFRFSRNNLATQAYAELDVELEYRQPDNSWKSVGTTQMKVSLASNDGGYDVTRVNRFAFSQAQATAWRLRVLRHQSYGFAQNRWTVTELYGCPPYTRTITPSRTPTPTFTATLTPADLSAPKLDLEVWHPTTGVDAYQSRLAARIVNHGTVPVPLNRISVRAWVKVPLGSGLSSTGYANNNAVYQANGGWVGIVPQTAVSNAALPAELNCQTGRLATHVLTFAFPVSGNLTLPANGGYLSSFDLNANSLGGWQLQPWALMDQSSDYSKPIDGGGNATGRQDVPQFVLYVDGQAVCEWNSPVATDPLSGVEPCDLPSCTQFTFTPSPSSTVTKTPTRTATPSISTTFSHTGTATPSSSRTATPTFSSSSSATASSTETPSSTATVTETSSGTVTLTGTLSSTATTTPTPTFTGTVTGTISPTASITPTRSSTRSATPSPSATVTPYCCPIPLWTRESNFNDNPSILSASLAPDGSSRILWSDGRLESVDAAGQSSGNLNLGSYFKVLIDSNGELYLIGNGVLARYDASGNLRWSQAIDTNFYSGAVLVSDNVVAIAFERRNLVQLYDAGGNLTDSLGIVAPRTLSVDGDKLYVYQLAGAVHIFENAVETGQIVLSTYLEEAAWLPAQNAFVGNQLGFPAGMKVVLHNPANFQPYCSRSSADIVKIGTQPFGYLAREIDPGSGRIQIRAFLACDPAFTPTVTRTITLTSTITATHSVSPTFSASPTFTATRTPIQGCCLAQAPVDMGPIIGEFDADGGGDGFAYFMNLHNGGLYRWNDPGAQSLGLIPTNFRARAMAVDPVSQRIFVAAVMGIYTVPLAGGPPTLYFAAGADSIAIDVVERRLYFTQGPMLRTIDMNNGGVTGTQLYVGNATSMKLHSRNKLVVALEAGGFAFIDPYSGALDFRALPSGSEEASLLAPKDVAVRSDGSIVISDPILGRVKVYSGNGDYLCDLIPGAGQPALQSPGGLAVVGGRVWLFEFPNRVRAFDCDAVPSPTASLTPTVDIATLSCALQNQRPLVVPTAPVSSVAVQAVTGEIAVLYTEGSWIERYAQDGTLLKRYQQFPGFTGTFGLRDLAYDVDGSFLGIDAAGRLNRLRPGSMVVLNLPGFSNGARLTVDSSGGLYTLEQVGFGLEISRYERSGPDTWTLAWTWQGDQALGMMWSLALDAQGNLNMVAIGDGSTTIYRFDPLGSPPVLTPIQPSGTAFSQIQVDSDGNYVLSRFFTATDPRFDTWVFGSDGSPLRRSTWDFGPSPNYGPTTLALPGGAFLAYVPSSALTIQLFDQCSYSGAPPAALSAARLVPGAKALTASVSAPDLLCAPNPLPGRGIVQVALAEAGPARVRILNILGEPVWSQELEFQGPTVQNLPLDLAALANGVYFAILEQDQGQGWKALKIFKLALAR